MLLGLPFTISFEGFMNFFLGMAVGVVLFIVFLSFFFYRGKKANLEKIKRPENEVKQEDILRMIKNQQDLVKANIKSSKESKVKMIYQASYDLTEEISRYFFPKSKYPNLELSVHELLDLTHYISNRVDNTLDKPLIRKLKNVRVVQIVKVIEKKNSFGEGKVAQTMKKYKVAHVAKLGVKMLKSKKQHHYIRSAIFSATTEIASAKISDVIIGIVGEETTKVYSKKLFDKDIELDIVEKTMQELIDEAERKETTKKTINSEQ